MEQHQQRTLWAAGMHLAKLMMGIGATRMPWGEVCRHGRQLAKKPSSCWHEDLTGEPSLMLNQAADSTAGILAVPRVFGLLGVGTATIWLIFIAGLTGLSMHSLTKATTRTGLLNYRCANGSQ
jgi:hypothetical protein